MKLAFLLASVAPNSLGEGRDRVLSDGTDDDEVAVVCSAALARRGHEVCLVGAGPRPFWLPAPLPYIDLLTASGNLSRQDLLLTTSWSSIQAARSLRCGPVSHLCHRFEGDLATSDRMAEVIDQAYSMVPAGLALSARLAEFLERRFGRTSHVVALPLERGFGPRFRLGPPRLAPRILVGASDEDPQGLTVVASVAGRLAPTSAPADTSRQVLLISTHSRPGDASALAAWPRASFASALRRGDLALLAQHAPVLRLLQCAGSGVPVLALEGGPCADLIRHARVESPAPDGESLYLQAERLLHSRAAWRSARRESLEFAHGYREALVTARLERAIGELARGLD